jgi:hypothetical protein
MKNSISLDLAKKMTALYRRYREDIDSLPVAIKDILPISETFGREAFDAVLSQEGCTGVRIYYGMSDDLKVHAIIVGVNEKNEDMLPALTAPLATSSTTRDPVIIEDSSFCPPYCAPASPLNT